jgi:UDP-N-acetylmuramate--alanine ligase
VLVERAVDLPEIIPGLLHAGDIVLTLGAGDIGAVAAALPQQLAAATIPFGKRGGRKTNNS